LRAGTVALVAQHARQKRQQLHQLGVVITEQCLGLCQSRIRVRYRLVELIDGSLVDGQDLVDFDTADVVLTEYVARHVQGCVE